MGPQEPSIGRTVHYQLTEQDVIAINRRRADFVEMMKKSQWQPGAQAHVGAEAQIGETLPMVITKVHTNGTEGNDMRIDGQVFLNGNDTLWVKEIPFGDGFGQWNWPERR